MKLWDKGFSTDQKIDHFTVGNDRELDLLLAKYDVIASKAHAKMLGKIGLLTNDETISLVKELDNIAFTIEEGSFTIEDTFEDMHSKIEFLLTERLGDTGKKIHTARSRNDQVLVAMHLYLKDELKEIKSETVSLFNLLMDLAEKHKEVLVKVLEGKHGDGIGSIWLRLIKPAEPIVLTAAWSAHRQAAFQAPKSWP